MTRPPKKSATLEIRLPHAVKEDFMARCKAEDSSASDVIRGYIDAHLARPISQPEKEPLMTRLKPIAGPSVALAALVVAGAFVAFAANPSRAAPDLRTIFNQFDRDHDGTLTLEEFRAGQDDDRIMIVERRVKEKGRGEAAGPPERVLHGPIIIPMRGAPDGRPPPGPPPGLEKGGERPSPEMAQSMARREFGRMDMDADSRVTFAEFETSHRALLRSSFVALDANEDGRLSAEELAIGAPGPRGDLAQRRAHGAEVLRGLDRNGDSAVTWDEFSIPPT
ncbi:MAG: EF-hand domain-containing protein [Hyphomonadaceae bacterium]|nr:EF-hand domain-containing protein [Hyphomonadaceae bacterium]